MENINYILDSLADMAEVHREHYNDIQRISNEVDALKHQMRISIVELEESTRILIATLKEKVYVNDDPSEVVSSHE